MGFPKRHGSYKATRATADSTVRKTEYHGPGRMTADSRLFTTMRASSTHEAEARDSV